MKSCNFVIDSARAALAADVWIPTEHKSILRVNRGVFMFWSICSFAVGVLVMAYGPANKAVVAMSSCNCSI